jgi:hypothetical protein
MPSLGTYQRAHSLVNMRWFAHVLARLAIAASCTSTAAALDAQADRSKSLSSADSSWGRMMPNSSQSANSITRRYGFPGGTLYIRSRDGRDIVHDGLTRAPRLDEADVRSRQSVMLPMTQPDRQNTPPWWSPIPLHLSCKVLRYMARHTAALRTRSRLCLSIHLLPKQVLQSWRRIPGARDVELWLSFLRR